jgi:hypothetical protein
MNTRYYEYSTPLFASPDHFHGGTNRVRAQDGLSLILPARNVRRLPQFK